MNNRKIKIAIVGGGISGCSSAYFLRDLFGDNVELVLFEKSDHIGGRMETSKFDGRDYELGALVLHSSNFYMHSFLKALDLEKCDVPKESDKYVAFYDSEGITFCQEGNYTGILGKLSTARYFGVDIVKFTQWAKSFIESFSKIYKLQGKERFTFRQLEDLLNKIDPELFEISQSSLKQLLDKRGYNERIINLASVSVLTTYGQSLDVDGFAGLCCQAGVGDHLWSIKGGNKLVPLKLLEKSGAKVMLNTEIKSISKSSENPDSKNVIVYQNENGEKISDDSYDYVIIGMPLYHDTISKEEFNLNFETKKEFEDLEMQLTISYFIYGNMILFPNLPNDKKVDLHSVDPNIPYQSVRIHLPCDYEQSKDSHLYKGSHKKLYKVDSNQHLTTQNFSKIFEEGYEIVKKKEWQACPKFHERRKPHLIPDIVLDDEKRKRVYYLNAVEWSICGMEISCISARNISLLIAEKENISSKNFFNNNF